MILISTLRKAFVKLYLIPNTQAFHEHMFRSLKSVKMFCRCIISVIFVLMTKYSLKATPLLVLMMIIGACSSQEKPLKSPIKPKVQTVTIEPETAASPAAPRLQLPAVNREFRGAWIATVANINWPTRNNLSTEQQKAEAIRQLDLLKDLHFNAVIFQARPAADAFYQSELEPWSYFLTGQAGRAPQPFYDPLEFWITEAHKRGMELHVWLNPYRAHHTTGGTLNSSSMVRRMPAEIVKLRNGTYWYDPSNPKTQDHVSAVVRDLVKRYDLDGVHFDDYFYPYREYNGGRDFPDNETWNVYKNSGGTLSRADWRRGNVNRFIKRIYEEIRAEKSHVKFGISPFGIWKSGFPEDVSGTSQYDELFADARLWLNEGWVDYFAPQLYWREEGPQRFSSLLKWWEMENTKKRHLWPGLNTVGVKDVPDRPAEILKQISLSRNILQDSDGEIHYSIAGLLNSPQMQSALKNGPYREKALVPASPWMPAVPVAKPSLQVKHAADHYTVHWQSKKPEQVFRWVLYARYGNTWETEILEKIQEVPPLAAVKHGQKLNTVALKAVDRLGNESDYDSKEIR